MMRDHEHGEYKVRAVRASDLSATYISVWSQMLSESPTLTSPFFAPEFTLAVASVIPDVWVAIVEKNNETVAFLPFERHRFAIGGRLRLCDYQAVIAQPDFRWDARALIDGCGLRCWDFDHLLASQEFLKPYHRLLKESPVIDLSNGFEDYVHERRTSGTEYIKKTRNLMRKLAREVGPLRFESHFPDQAVLLQLLKWRASRYQDSRHPFDLVVDILGRLLVQRNPDCQGALSVLFAGNEIVASHFGLCSRQVWHYWFPAYNPLYEKYSPGMILLLKAAEFAPTIGIKMIDLGKGEQSYKRRLMSGSVTVAEGSVEVSPWLSLSRVSVRVARSWVRKNPLLGRAARCLQGMARDGAIDF